MLSIVLTWLLVEWKHKNTVYNVKPPPEQRFLGCWIDDFAEHEYGIRVALYNSKEERPVDRDFMGNRFIFSSVLNLRTSFCHLKHNLVEDL